MFHSITSQPCNVALQFSFTSRAYNDIISISFLLVNVRTMDIILYFEAGLSGRTGPEMVLDEITLLK